MEMTVEKQKKRASARQMIDQYTNQPSELPNSLRTEIDCAWSGESIQLYAYVDLNKSFQLTEGWLALGPNHVCTAFKAKDGTWAIQSIDRSSLKSVMEISGLSCNRLVFEDETGPPLVVRYSHRQSRSVGLIKFLLEQQVELENEVNSEPEVREDRNADDLYTENVLQPVKEAQNSVASKRSTVIWRLLSYLLPYKKQVTLGMTSAILMTLVSLIPAYLTGYIIDHVIKPFQGGQITRVEAQGMGVTIILGLVVIYVLREVFAWVRLRTMSVMGEKVAKDLRDEVYSHLHTLSLSYFSKKQTGSLISRVGADTDRIWDFVAFGVVEVTTSLIMLTSLGVVLIVLDWPLGLIVTLPVPLFLWVIARHGKKMQELFLRAWRKWSRLTDCLSDTIPGIRVVKAFHKQDYETDRFMKRNEAVLTEFNRIHQEWTSFWPLLMVSIQFIVIAVWTFGLPRVLDHIGAFNAGQTLVGLSPGVFVSFVLYLGMYVQPIEVIGQMARMVNRATSSAYRVFEVLDTEPQVIESKSPVRIKPLKGAVSFNEVTFSYDGVRKIIQNMSFDVKPGEMIGLVGASGGGKTTITNLMARFYDIDRGQILIDGVDIKNMDLECLREQMGIVLQDPYLFHGSVLDNIRYAQPDATMDQVVEAAKAANAHEFICKLTHSYDTVVGERGQSLSGGERQRVSIARAILRNPRILILDEATSAVDTETERKIQGALDHLVKGRTVFAIAHRLSTLTRAHRILVIENGRIAEQGTHESLLKIKDGRYRKLVHLQQDLQGIET